MATVTSLNTRSGVVNLQSSDASIGIVVSGVNDINLIASKQGSQGGVTSLNTLTGANFITSTGGSIVITTPVGYPSGHNVNIEAVQGGVVGVNTINTLPSDAVHNFSIVGSGAISVAPDGLNGIVISADDGVLTVNGQLPVSGDILISSGGAGILVQPGVAPNDIVIVNDGVLSVGANVDTPSAGAVRLLDGAGISLIQVGGDITVAYTGSVADAIETINTIVPVATNFEIIGGTDIQVVAGVGGITLNYTGAADGVLTINSQTPDVAGDFVITNGTGISIGNGGALPPNYISIINEGILSVETPSGGALIGAVSFVNGTGISITNTGQNISVEYTGSVANAVETINTIVPVATNFEIIGGTDISVVAGVGGITLNYTGAADGVLTVNALLPVLGDIQIAAGAGLSVASAGNTVTLAYTGSVADAIETINSIVPVANNFEIIGGTDISVVAGVGGVTLNYVGVLNNVETINSISSDAFHNFNITAGAGLAIFPIANGIDISYTGSVADAIESINSVVPVGTNFLLNAGTNMSIVAGGPGLTINNTYAPPAIVVTQSSNFALTEPPPNAYFALGSVIQLSTVLNTGISYSYTNVGFDNVAGINTVTVLNTITPASSPPPELFFSVSAVSALTDSFRIPAVTIFNKTSGTFVQNTCSIDPVAPFSGTVIVDISIFGATAAIGDELVLYIPQFTIYAGQ